MQQQADVQNGESHVQHFAVAGGGSPKGDRSRMTYRPEIDGLRAVAVIAVIINHFSKEILPAGYLGVDVFFVISGYVISGSLLGRPRQSFREGLAGFYARRIKRLVPALCVCVLLTSLAICLFNPSPGVSLQTGLAALIGAANIYLYSQSTDYFAPSTELNAFTHTWSLGVEEQFYLVFPLLLWLAGFWRLGKASTAVVKKRLVWMIGILVVFSALGFAFLYSSNLAAVYFLMPFRFWELGAGCLLALLAPGSAARDQGNEGGRNLHSIATTLTAIALIGSFLISEQGSSWTTFLAITLTCMLIGQLRSGGLVFALLSHPWAVWIGKISYSLYLWHWSVLCISRWTIGVHGWTIPLQVLAIFILAVMSYYLVEKPLRFGRWHSSRLVDALLGSLEIGRAHV